MSSRVASACPFAAHGTPLVRAAERGQLPIVRRLVEAGAEPGRTCGCEAGESPLWSAVASGQLEIARYLLAHGAPPDARAFGERTALHVAAMRGRDDLVRLLLTHGADRDARDDRGRTPAEWAALKRHVAASQALQAEPASATAGAAGGGAAVTRRDARMLVTGIRALDLFAPLPVGGITRWLGSTGLGQAVIMAELTARLGASAEAWWLGFEQGLLVTNAEISHALAECGVDRAAHTHVALARVDASAAERRDLFGSA